MSPTHQPITFSLWGTGWRADFYRRIAALAPEHFRLATQYTRSPEKAAELARSAAHPVTCDLAEFLALPVDLVVLSVKRGNFFAALEVLREKGLAVLCETPPAENVGELNALWKSWGDSPRLQVAEQYFLQPMYAAWLEAVRLGLLGEVSNLSQSAVHGYHAVNLMRRFLGVGLESVTITGQSFKFPVVNTSSRQGPDFSGTVVEAARQRATLVFASGKTAFHDFSGLQYHSTIRTRQFNVQGTRGEIDDLTLRSLKPDNSPTLQTLERVDRGVYNNQDWSHQGMHLGERVLYQSPLPHARLNDDELAIASCLLGMADSLRTGVPFSSLRDALQDTYLALLLDEAATKGQTVRSERQSWHV